MLQLKVKGVLGTFFLDISFETMNVLLRFLGPSHTPVSDILNNDFNVNDWIVKGNEPQAQDYMALLLYISELLE